MDTIIYRQFLPIQVGNNLQPQIELKTGRIVSAEALVCWKSPVNGLIPPIKFIPVFEQNGFIIKLDLFVWEEAIRTISRWQKEQKKGSSHCN